MVRAGDGTRAAPAYADCARTDTPRLAAAAARTETHRWTPARTTAARGIRTRSSSRPSPSTAVGQPPRAPPEARVDDLARPARRGPRPARGDRGRAGLPGQAAVSARKARPLEHPARS